MNAWTWTSWVAIAGGAYVTAWLFYYIVAPKWTKWPGRLLLLVWLAAYAGAAYAFFTQPRSKGETQFAVLLWIIALVFPPQFLPFHARRRLRQTASLLDDSDPDWRREGVRLLSKWPRTDELAHHALVHATSNSDPDVRRRAVMELSQPLAVKELAANAPALMTPTLTALGDALNDPDPDVAAAASNGLVWIVKTVDLRRWKDALDAVISRFADRSSVAQPTDAEHDATAAESEHSILWRCPRCKGVFKKRNFEFLTSCRARVGHLGGVVLCEKCGGRTPLADVYGGKYDVKGEEK